MQHFKGLVKPYVLWSFLLIALPLVLVVLYSVTTGDNSLIFAPAAFVLPEKRLLL